MASRDQQPKCEESAVQKGKRKVDNASTTSSKKSRLSTAPVPVSDVPDQFNSAHLRAIANSLGIQSNPSSMSPENVREVILGTVLGEREHSNRDLKDVDDTLKTFHKFWADMEQFDELGCTKFLRHFRRLRLESTLDAYGLFSDYWNSNEPKYRKRKFQGNQSEATAEESTTNPEQVYITPQERSLLLPQLYNIMGVKIEISGPLPTQDQVFALKGRGDHYVLAMKWRSAQRVGANLAVHSQQAGASYPSNTLALDLIYINKPTHPSGLLARSRQSSHCKADDAYKNSREYAILDSILKKKVRLVASKVLLIGVGFLGRDGIGENYGKWMAASHVVHHLGSINKPEPYLYIHRAQHEEYNSDDTDIEWLFGAPKETGNLEKVNDIQAILNIDSDTVVFCLKPSFPVRQILADWIPQELYARFPPAIICTTIDMDDRDYDDRLREQDGSVRTDKDNNELFDPDPNHPRCQLLASRYRHFPISYEGACPSGLEHLGAVSNSSLFGNLSLYVRPDLVSEQSGPVQNLARR